MAEDKKDIVMDGMPGADPITEEDAKTFEVDLNFEDEVPAEEEVVEEAEAESEEEEVEFPAEEEVVEEVVEEVEEEENADDAEDAEDQDEAEVPGEPEEEVVEDTTDIIEEEEIEKPKAPEKAPMVPKSRLDEVLAKNKKMQKQLEDIEKQQAETQAQAPQYDFEAQEIAYQEAILDGDSARASTIRSEIRAAEKEQLMFEMQAQMGHTVSMSQAEQELAVKAQEIGDTFDVLNENSENFNLELAEEVRDLRDAFVTQGYTPADSLAKATEYTLAAKMPHLLNGAEDTVAAETTKQNKAIVEKRQKTTVKKKLEASKSQPPKLKGEGTATRKDKVADINVLSDDEFSALPEDTLKRMRGDFG
tara:strand:+ start:711 stop:1796 length:1086 start_codon:yes stop_codon:yes gene_type:complete